MSNIAVPNLDGVPHTNWWMWQIGKAKREGTNFLIVPRAKLRKGEKAYLRKRGCRVTPLPLRGQVLVEWEHERPRMKHGRIA